MQMGEPGERDELWDLTRGDAEDNRSSPKWRGWRGLVVSTALEFNYLSAAITFVWLIVLPAIVVGLVVPGAIVLARGKLGVAQLIAIRPAVALISLAFMVGAVLWLARALLAVSLDNFWHLHQTLVFPLFVALREVIGIGLEAVPSRALDDRALHRLRRASTVLATMLLAGSGVALAFAVPFSTFADLENLRHMSLAAVTSAALGNALVVLGLSMTIESVFWFAREISSVPPVLNWAPSQYTPAMRTLRIAHLSDLHVVGERYGYRMEPGTSGPCGNERAARAFCQLERIQANQALDRIIVTGDVTDAGTRAEWLEFLALVQAAPDLRRRLLFVPGNHDVNIVDRTNPGRLDLPWSVTGALRKLRVVLALDAVQGESVHVVDRVSGALGCTLREYLRSGNRSTLLRDLAERGTWRGRWEISKVWEAIFPLVVPPSDEGCGVILLDSNADRYFSLTNAIGFINREQLRALNSILRSGPATGWIVAVHHHLVEYPIRGLGLRERVGVVLVNASDVLRVIERSDRPVAILHGHRHRDWLGTRGRTVLCSAPSVTLGDKGAQSDDGSFSIYDIALTSDGRVQVPIVNRVSVT
jgi:3',5'-cyclic AMP phosphodiesterase CpdA